MAITEIGGEIHRILVAKDNTLLLVLGVNLFTFCGVTGLLQKSTFHAASILCKFNYLLTVHRDISVQ